MANKKLAFPRHDIELLWKTGKGTAGKAFFEQLAKRLGGFIGEPGTYGDATHTVQIVINANGEWTISEVPISGGAGAGAPGFR